MVNLLMGAKMEPMGSVDSSSPLGYVKLELDHEKDDDDKVEVKIEMLGDLFGDSFGCSVSSMLGEGKDHELLLSSDPLNFGPPSLYSGSSGELDSHTSITTIKVPLHTEMDDGNYPPVLSIPGSFSSLSPSHGLHISISPISQGADTTSLVSPETPRSTASSSSSQKKTVFTAKGLLFCHHSSLFVK